MEVTMLMRLGPKDLDLRQEHTPGHVSDSDQTAAQPLVVSVHTVGKRKGAVPADEEVQDAS